MIVSSTPHAIKILALGLFLILISSCSDNLSQLERVHQHGSLRIGMIATPPLYFPDESQFRGLDYEIISSYADSLGVETDIVRASKLSELIQLLKQGKVHVVVSGSVPYLADENIAIAGSYRPNHWYVIGNRQNFLPDDAETMPANQLVVAEGSRPSQLLQSLRQDLPTLEWKELPDSNNRQILEQINLNNIKLSVINEDVFNYYQHLYPELKIAFTLPSQSSSHWLTLKNGDASLSASLLAFINDYKSGKQLERLNLTYFNHLNRFNYIDSVYFVERIESKLPEYWPIFVDAASQYEFDERFLASVSYQESHWDPKARSVTGVRGMMMLTNDTAKRVGVEDRLDPEQSIHGGAKYLNIIKQSLPESVKEPDRSWMTLASYNVGLGHLEDARVLAQKAGDNPNLWIDVAAHLPKLSQKKWYQTTRHGYARGKEPVAFVRKIHRYFDILRLYQQEELLEKLDKPIEVDKLTLSSPIL